MNYIDTKAQDFVRYHIEGGISDDDEVIRMVKNDLYDIDSETDKLSFLSIILEGNQKEYDDHLTGCKNINSCPTNKQHEKVNYYLHQELNKLGFSTSEDAFTKEEKESFSETLDQILADLKDLKDGQQIIYDDLKAEIEELKRWFLLGKKNLRQLAVGKVSEMVAGGVISELTAKPILNAIKVGFQTLIG